MSGWLGKQLRNSYSSSKYFPLFFKIIKSITTLTWSGSEGDTRGGLTGCYPQPTEVLLPMAWHFEY